MRPLPALKSITRRILEPAHLLGVARSALETGRFLRAAIPLSVCQTREAANAIGLVGKQASWRFGRLAAVKAGD